MLGSTMEHMEVFDLEPDQPGFEFPSATFWLRGLEQVPQAFRNTIPWFIQGR